MFLRPGLSASPRQPAHLAGALPLTDSTTAEGAITDIGVERTVGIAERTPTSSTSRQSAQRVPQCGERLRRRRSPTCAPSLHGSGRYRGWIGSATVRRGRLADRRRRGERRSPDDNRDLMKGDPLRHAHVLLHESTRVVGAAQPRSPLLAAGGGAAVLDKASRARGPRHPRMEAQTCSPKTTTRPSSRVSTSSWTPNRTHKVDSTKGKYNTDRDQALHRCRDRRHRLRVRGGGNDAATEPPPLGGRPTRRHLPSARGGGPLTVTDIVTKNGVGMGLYDVKPLALRCGKPSGRLPRFFLPHRDKLNVPRRDAERVHWDPAFARKTGNPTTYDYGHT